MAFTFNWGMLPSRAIRNAFNQLLSTSTGHDHDGTNSKAVESVKAALALTTPVITGGTSTAKEIVTAYAADGAIAIGTGVARLTKGSAGAYTLAAPASGDDGTVLHITAGTDFAHVVAIATTSLLDGTNTPKGKCTTAAYIGSGITVVAVSQKWHLRANVAATLAAS